MREQTAQPETSAMSDFEHFSDGESLASLPPSILAAIRKHVPFKANAKRVDFVGIVWNDDQPCIFWPKGLKNSSQQGKHAKLLIDVLRRAGKSRSVQSKIKGAGGQIVFPVELEILEHYLEYGLFETREARFAQSVSGKIDWGRTIKRQTPSPGANNVPIYLDPISSSQSSADHLIRQLHAHAVGVCDRKFAWLLSSKDRAVAREHHNQKLIVTTSRAIAIVKKELHRQFSDVKKFQLQLLLHFFQRLHSLKPESSGFLGTDLFEFVWEDMCGVYFGTQRAAIRYPAVPSYFSPDTRHQRESKNQGRPDILLANDKRLGIVDAKYYDFGLTKPPWSDLVKQFFYAKAFNHRGEYQSVTNSFAAPKTEGAVPTYASVIDPELNIPLNAEFPPIKIMYIDVLEIMEHYRENRINAEWRNLALGILEKN